MEFSTTPAILVATHGRFGEELLASAAMIYGQIGDVYSLPLLPGTSPDDYQAEMQALVERHDGDIVVLVDVIGGTPFNTLVKTARVVPVSGVAGVNLPMVLEALELRETERDATAFSAGISAAGQTAVRDLSPLLLKSHAASQTQSS